MIGERACEALGFEGDRFVVAEKNPYKSRPRLSIGAGRLAVVKLAIEGSPRPDRWSETAAWGSVVHRRYCSRVGRGVGRHCWRKQLVGFQEMVQAGEYTPSILHTHGGVAGFYGRMAALRHRDVRTVHTYHGIHYLHLGNRVTYLVQGAVDRFLAPRTDRIICVARSDFDLALQHDLALKDRTIVIPNGIDLRRFTSGAGRRRDSAARRTEGLVVGTIGRLHVQKGHRFLLQAASEILRAMPSVRFRIIGEGELREELERLARKLRISSHVEFAGLRTAIPEELAEMDLFVLPSLWEGLPFVLLEAMAARKPVVATRVNGVQEIIEDGKNGVLVPPADSAALAGKIQSLLQDPNRMKQLGAAGRKTVAAEYDVATMVRRTEEVYRSILTTRLKSDGR